MFFIPSKAFLWRFQNKQQVLDVKNQSFVRAVVEFKPELKISKAFLYYLNKHQDNEFQLNLVVADRFGNDKDMLLQEIKKLGGEGYIPSKQLWRVRARLLGKDALSLLSSNYLVWMESAGNSIYFFSSLNASVNFNSGYKEFFDTARVITGAYYLEEEYGFKGEGVRGEVLDSGLEDTHPAFSNTPIIRLGNNPFIAHGTNVYGVVFSNGIGYPEARGFLPEGQGVFSSSFIVGDRYQQTAELVDPSLPYQCVFQTNSWSNGITTDYDALSQEIDTIAYDFDLLILQAMGNFGSQSAAPQAWGKNTVAVGGINHLRTIDRSDDIWDLNPNFRASIGPAADGRIKPDLSAFFDGVYTTSVNGSFTDGFGGTSAATPIIAGVAGLIAELWSKGEFGNTVTGSSVFENRPPLSTYKALLVHSAKSYEFNGIDHDLTRIHQGWGIPDLRYIYDHRNRLYIIDEKHLIKQNEFHRYVIKVKEGEPLRATLVYTDLPAVPFVGVHRVNDLTIITSPSGVVYWGNNGLLEGNESTPGGVANHLDNVENIWLSNPEIGTWVLDVIADEINQDSVPSTPDIDSSYSLVVSADDFYFLQRR